MKRGGAQTFGVFGVEGQRIRCLEGDDDPVGRKHQLQVAPDVPIEYPEAVVEAVVVVQR